MQYGSRRDNGPRAWVNPTVDAPSERRQAHGPRLALTMAELEAGFGDFERALYWSVVAEDGLGRLPRHYDERLAAWSSEAMTSRGATGLSS